MTKPILFGGAAAIVVIGAVLLFNSSSSPKTSPAAQSPSTQAPAATSSFTLADVAKHNVATDCWFAVNGSVYDLSEFIATGMHKAGMDPVIRSCGTDATQIFAQAHGSKQRPYDELKGFLIGELKP